MKDMLKKKIVLFPLILFGQLVITLTIAIVFNLETTNSVLSAIYAYILCFTIICFLIKILKDHKKQILDADIVLFSLFAVWFLYAMIVVMVINIIYITIAIMLGLVQIS